MLISKKYLALCATGLIGFGVATPVATSVCADQKSGETTITYQTEAKPAEWGLSVPAQTDMDKKGEDSGGVGSITYSNIRVAIVTEDGKDFTDSSKDHSFTVTPTSSLALSSPNGTSMLLRMSNFGQGDSDVNKPKFGQEYTTPVTLSTKADKSNAAPFVYYQVGAETANLDQYFANTSATCKISWTAVENN